MADNICISPDSMLLTAKKLGALADELNSIGKSIKRVDLSAISFSDLLVGGVPISEVMKLYGDQANKTSDLADKMAGNTKKALRMFSDCESSLCGDVDKIGETFAERLAASFDLEKLGKTLVGAFGPVGSFAKFLLSFDKDNWTKTLKNIGKQAKSAAKWIEKFPKYMKTNRFGNNYGTQNYVKGLLGLNRYNTSAPKSGFASISQSSNLSYRFGTEFKSGLKNTFVKSNGKANWLGIAGVAIDTAATGYENYQRYKSGEISAARGVVQTVTEVGGDLVLGTAVTAIVAATLPATAPVVAVVAISGAVIWGIDSLTKLVTGSDKGLVGTVAEGVGWLVDHPAEAWDNVTETAGKVWEGTKEVVSDVWNKTTDVVGNMMDKGTDLVSGFCKKVLGSSNGRCSILGFSF